jgi:GT2 family glycosyltransferase
MALRHMKTRLRIRVFLLDDASSDPRVAEFADIPGLIVVRHVQNLHFLRSCNVGFERTTAPFVLLLNNDTQVCDFALDHLIDAMTKDASVGASAPMLLYPNGRLQEAGCFLKSNGDSELIGVGEDPDDPRYNYARPIDYGSGACLMLRREALDGALFDEQFAPAYCEDADLCLRFRSNGWRIVYEPRARVIHHLSVSTARNSVRRREQMVRKNQQKLLEKWQDTLTTENRVRILAFYLPQFHPVPQNNVWWGKGFTEWTNTTRALPSFSGHYQPHLPADLGFYDLRLVDVLGEQQKLARRYGIEGFIVYYYNFNGARILEQPMENLLGRPDIDFRFALCWANENWTRHWDGGQRAALLTQQYSDETLDGVIEDFVRFGRDPRAIRVSGKLLALIYRPLLIPEVTSFAERMRTRFREEGCGEIHLVYVESMEMLAQNISPAGIGFDASVEFPPQGIAERYDRAVEITKVGWQGKLYDYSGTVKNSVMRPRPGYKRYAGVTPSWDNTPRQPLSATTLVGAQPESFQLYLEFKIDETVMFNVSDERLLFINAWNEWAEGAHLEPDRGYGHRWLGSVRNALLSKGIYFDF